ncbi:Transcriptional regulator MarR family [Lactiplantibacillus plantarum]|nr:Transcriptional regulator MarR family [Lactiplantibacillus plantarum]
MPPKTEYWITPFGQTLKPVIMAMETWDRQYNSVNGKPRQ